MPEGYEEPVTQKYTKEAFEEWLERYPDYARLSGSALKKLVSQRFDGKPASTIIDKHRKLIEKLVYEQKRAYTQKAFQEWIPTVFSGASTMERITSRDIKEWARREFRDIPKTLIRDNETFLREYTNNEIRKSLVGDPAKTE